MLTQLLWLILLLLGAQEEPLRGSGRVSSEPAVVGATDVDAEPSAEPVQPATTPEAEDATPLKADARAPSTATSSREGLLQRHMRELYGLLALCCLWLITRIYGSADTRPRRLPPTRHAPVTVEELGRTMFSLAKGEDFDAYRLLYLSGVEASRVLGPEHGQRYIAQRSLSALETAFEVLMEQIPFGTTYEGSSREDTGHCLMNVCSKDGEEYQISLGGTEQVGAILRLVTPGTGRMPSLGAFLEDSEDAITEIQI